MVMDVMVVETGVLRGQLEAATSRARHSYTARQHSYSVSDCCILLVMGSNEYYCIINSEMYHVLIIQYYFAATYIIHITYI